MLAKVLAQEGIGHLHVHFANSGATVGMLAAHYMRLPWSLTLHGISETDYPAGLLLPEKILEASFVACASYFMQAQAMRHVSPEHWHKFRIVRCGVDCARIQKISVSASRSETPRLICVGRLSPEKGHVGLLKVMRRLLDRGVVFDLNLVGDGPSRTAIEELVDGLDLRDRVRFSGYLSESDTLTAIAESDMLVLPSFMEGLPVVLVEAFALGKPVIASRVAGIPELVEHGKSGFLFTPSDSTALEDALERVLAAESTWTEMGRVGQARVEHEFEISTAAGILQRLFLPSRDAFDQRGSHAEAIRHLEE
jgi:glycosyltransferase involved in cell wall biosynthesis